MLITIVVVSGLCCLD